MRAEFSEFSYGFALSYEIMSALLPQVVSEPLFPSFVSDDDFGSSIEHGWPIFLRFKLAEYMKMPRARHWSDYDHPFFRLALPSRKHSNQHNLLRALAEREPEVYYAAPMFYRQIEFNQAFLANRILEQSVFIPLQALPDLTDDRDHHLTFCQGEPGVRWHSHTGQHLEVSKSGKKWLAQVKERAAAPRELGSPYFVELRSALIEMVKQRTLQPDLFLLDLPFDLENASPRVVFRDLRYLLVTYFGVETIVLHPRA